MCNRNIEIVRGTIKNSKYNGYNLRLRTGRGILSYTYKYHYKTLNEAMTRVYRPPDIVRKYEMLDKSVKYYNKSIKIKVRWVKYEGDGLLGEFMKTLRGIIGDSDEQ